MSYQHIKLAVADSVATLTLSREPLNVLNIAMMKEMNQAIDSLMGQPLKALVMDAEGKAFSAGVDVGEHLGDQVNEMIEVFHGIFRRLDRLGVPTVASLQGAALGGGCELAAYCDLVVASEKAKLGQPEILVGVFPPIAALVLPRQLGYKKAMELILTGETLSAPEALACGLVNQVVPPDELKSATEAMVAKLTRCSGLVLKISKQAVLAGLEGGLEAIERIYLDELMRTHDAVEGLKAFLEKRPPDYQDK